MSDNLRGVILMCIAMLAFTTGDSLMKGVTHDLPLFQTIFLRGILTTAALVAMGMKTLGQGQLRAALWPALRDRKLTALRSLAEAGASVTFFTALLHMPLATLSAIMQSIPLVVTLTAALLFAEPIGWRRILAISVGFIGVLLIIRPGTAGFDFWSVMGLASVGCVVLRDLSTRRISPQTPSVIVSIWSSGFVLCMGAVGAQFQGWQPVQPQHIALIACAAAVLIIGYMTSVMVMRVGDIAVVAPFRYTALVWAILFGWILFGTLPDSMTLIGAGIVVASGIYTIWREGRKAAA